MDKRRLGPEKRAFRGIIMDDLCHISRALERGFVGIHDEKLRSTDS